MSRGNNIYLATRMKQNRPSTKGHLNTFEALDSMDGNRKRKLNLKEVSTAQSYAFLEIWRDKHAQRLKRKPFIIAGSILIALLVTAGLIKLFEWVYL